MILFQLMLNSAQSRPLEEAGRAMIDRMYYFIAINVHCDTIKTYPLRFCSQYYQEANLRWFLEQKLQIDS